MIFKTGGWWRRGVGSICLPAVLVSGCADMQNAANSLSSGLQSIGESSFASERADPACFRERATLEQFEEKIDKALVAGAIGGAIIGGIAAAATGENIAAGIAIGGVSGLAATYLSKLTGVGPYQALQTMTTDLAAENQKTEQITQSIRSLRDCRVREADLIRADLKAKRIDRATAEARIGQVRIRNTEDLAKAREVANSVSERTAGYIDSYNEIAAANGVGGLEVANTQVKKTRKPPKPKLSAEQSAKLRLNTKSERNGVTALRDDCVTNVRKRDDCVRAVNDVENTGFQL